MIPVAIPISSAGVAAEELRAATVTATTTSNYNDIHYPASLRSGFNTANASVESSFNMSISSSFPFSSSSSSAIEQPVTLTLPQPMNQAQKAKEFLFANNWPNPLQEVFFEQLKRIPIRYFICDDSGSMSISDGKRIASVHGGGQRFVMCSRWAEMVQAMKFHAKFSNAAGVASQFRLLNAYKPFYLGYQAADDEREFTALFDHFDNTPSGATPICRHLREVTEEIIRYAPQLRQNNQKAVVIIITDGESSDGDVREALRPLEHLPVWVVVRLCTNEDKVVDYWNNVDSDLELEMDVIDDFAGEAKEIKSQNPWFTYGEPLHRMREFGVILKEVDLLDETRLPIEQIPKICALVLGPEVRRFSAPETNWPAFMKELKDFNPTAPKIWSPIEQTVVNWIDPAKMHSTYHPSVCSIC